MVQGCTNTKKTFWTEDEFTVTTSPGIRNRDVRVPEIVVRESIRGWNNKTHQSRAQALLVQTDKEMVVTLRNDRDIILIPRNWWSDKTGSLETEDRGWWYTVTEPVKFRVCYENPLKRARREQRGKGNNLRHKECCAPGISRNTTPSPMTRRE
jgi:hypothetical protein